MKSRNSKRRRFVVHEHHARRLHFDFRLEVAGVLKSWAVPKGPSLDPAEKRLAVEVEDHSIAYGHFEGTIAEGRYGAGEVRIWDEGFYEAEGDAAAQLKKGKLTFEMFGGKLRGTFSLVRMSRGEGQWLLIKARDGEAAPGWELETILEPRGAKRREGKLRLVVEPPRGRAAGSKSPGKAKGVKSSAAKARRKSG
ncbi:MAG: DNA polymerase ligase N-terminal domain-containing protein [Pyrinomonadaceae bacterium]